MTASVRFVQLVGAAAALVVVAAVIGLIVPFAIVWLVWDGLRDYSWR